MSQTLETVRRARLRHAKHTLETASTHVADLERAHATAVEAYEAARAVMDDLAAELDEARSHQRHAASSLEQLLGSMQRDVVKRLPADVLLQIFDAATHSGFYTTGDAYGFLMDGFGAATEVSFVLSAVCAQWRRTALNHASLWSCVDLDYAEGSDPVAHLELVRVLLHRSRASPLRIRLDWATYDEWYACESYSTLLKELCLHGARWRAFEFHGPDAEHMQDALRVLKGPLPVLRYLCITAQDLETKPTSTKCDYLPFAPSLRTIVICGPHSLLPSTPSRWGALRALRLVFPQSFELTWNLLSAAAPTVESLVLISRAAPPNGSTLPPLVLPKLTALNFNLAADLAFEPFVDALRFPKLEHLGTYGHMLRIAHYWQPFMERVAPTVTRLNVCSDVGLPVLRVARSLVRLQHLTIGESDSKCTIHKEFFADKQLWVEEAVWPELSSVRLADGANDLNKEGLMLPFIRWRTEQLREQPQGDGRPIRLKQFILDDPDAPQWLKCEIERLIAAGAAEERPS
ncbi:hypothetical protein AURDEDRAFT_181795 [Auricularia subglabra TFB-10046 SS5]|nr:hypothetical protein AURDEDRAFT_181795 [Auricularia subglabra TFB-10046 SS5]